MQITETEARELLVAIGKPAAGDPEHYPVSRVEKRLNEVNDQGVSVLVADAIDPGDQRLTDLWKSLADAKLEGEDIVVVPVNGAVTLPTEVEMIEETIPDAETLQESEDVITTAEPIKRKRGRPRKNLEEGNGHVPAAKAKPAKAAVPKVKFKTPAITEIQKPKLLKATHTLAKHFRDMERYPHDRNLSPTRCEFLKNAIRQGLFRGSEWVSCKCSETGLVYRLNGKHTSAVLCELYEAGEEVPDIVQLVREYEAKTLADMAHLFASFDPRQSARGKADIVRGFAATAEETASLPPRLLNLVTTGLAFSLWERNYKRVSTQEQSVLLLQNTEFAAWVDDLLSDQKEAKHLKRMPVVAAMARTWKVDETAATEFWTKIRDDSDDDKNAPTRVLYRWLLKHKIGAVRNTSDAVSDREAYLVCLLAWNAWRQEQDTVSLKYTDATETPDAV